jgi:hypothetical protein
MVEMKYATLEGYRKFTRICCHIFLLLEIFNHLQILPLRS